MSALMPQQRPRKPIRIRWRTPITLIILLAVFGGGSYWGYKKLTAPDPGPACVTVTLASGRLTPGRVLVNIYNAGAKAGSAGTIGTVLRNRHFVVGKVTNDENETVSYATVRGASASAPEVKLVLGQFPTTLKVPVEPDGRSDHSVDVLLGPKFTQLPKTGLASVAIPGGKACVSPDIPGVTPSPSPG